MRNPAEPVRLKTKRSNKHNANDLAASAKTSLSEQGALKEERRVLEYASDGLNGKVGCLGKPRGLERFDTSARGRILNGEAQVLELIADGVCQIPVLGGTGLGASLENLGSCLVHIVTRVGN